MNGYGDCWLYVQEKSTTLWPKLLDQAPDHWPLAACLCALKEKLEASWLFKLLNCMSWPRGCGLDSGRRTKTRVYWWWPAAEWAVITRVVSSPTPAGGSLSLLQWQTRERERERDKKQEERQCHVFFHLATSPCSWFCGSVTINRVVSFTSHFLNIRLQTSKCEWFARLANKEFNRDKWFLWIMIYLYNPAVFPPENRRGEFFQYCFFNCLLNYTYFQFS